MTKVSEMTPEERKESTARSVAVRASFKNSDEAAQNRLSFMDPIRRSKVEARLKEMPESCRGGYIRAVSGKSAKAAVKSFCLECVGWQREEVRLCTSLACPLYPYRPFRG